MKQFSLLSLLLTLLGTKKWTHKDNHIISMSLISKYDIVNKKRDKLRN